jgi:N-methylhydantoinase A
MEAAAAAALRAEFATAEVRFERFAEMRYRGQRHNIKVPIPPSNAVPEIRAAFERDYLRRYGHADAKAPAEFQALHLSAFARLDRPQIERLPRAARAPQAPHTRPVYFAAAGGTIDTPVHDRYALPIGFGGAGPAVLEEYGSTTIVWPGDTFAIGAMGEIRIECGTA